MGNQRRLNSMWRIAGVVTLAMFGCSKEEDDAEQRRQLLSARERTEARQQRIDAQRVRSPAGELLPSTTVRAGIVLPRGFKPKFENDHDWTYDAQLPQEKVEAYFDQRLAVQEVKRTEGQVDYLAAREKSDPDAAARPVVVTVRRPPGKSETWTRIIVRERPPAPTGVEAAAQAVLRERMEQELQNAQKRR